MRPFWTIAIAPLLEALRPQRILEIGVDQGLTTRPLLEFAVSHGAMVEAIDPNPKIDSAEWKREFGPAFRLHRGLSVDILPELLSFDVALIDGDHNWFTVRGELQALEALATESERLPPLILLHDIGWPYARRDLYYDAATIPKPHRQPHERGGLLPGQSELVETGGFNAHLDHAIFEGGERNGVLTAVEDFVAASSEPWSFTTLTGHSGLGILAVEQLLEENGRLRDLVESFDEATALREVLANVERERIESEIGRQATLRSLTEARQRAAAVTEAEASETPTAEEEAERAAEVVSGQQELGNLASELSARDRALVEAQQELTTARTAAAEAAARIEGLVRELGDARAGVDEARRQVEGELLSTARALAEIEGRTAARERELELLRAQAEEARAAAQAATAQARAAREEADEVERARDRLERRQGSFERREEELEDELTLQRRARREAVQAREDAEHHVSNLTSRVAELEGALEDARRVAADHEQELRAAAKAIAERESEIAELAGGRLRLTADIADTRESLEQAVAEARAQANTAQAAVRELRERLEVREMESGALEEQLTQLREELANARADAEIARAQQRASDGLLTGIAAERDRLLAELGARPFAPAPAPAAPPASAAPPLAAATPPAVAAQPAPTPLSHVRFMDTELQAHEYFRTEYDVDARAPGADRLIDAIALPRANNVRGFLRADHDPAQAEPTVDVVVCVHNALDDVRLCLWSVLHKTDRPFRLVVVNDGSDDATTEYLEELVSAEPAINLIHRADPPHGYTIAANLGLRAATGDYLVLLNSDTIVTYGWLDRIVECGESDPAIGILGPLSNAASHQSVPELRSAGAWSTNPLPPFATPDAIAKLLERVSTHDRPRIPFINGFCYVIRRAVIDAIGYLDEEHFASGYCEENDFSVRAAEAGFELAVVDDGYVFHAKSKSFGVEGRKVIAKRNYEIFLDKHGRERIQAAVTGLESNTALAPLRARASDALSSPQSLASALETARHEALEIVFVLPGIGAGGSGGSHSIYQEVHGMRALGLDARIALTAKSFDRARAAYDDADEIFVPYENAAELAEVTATADVISATHFKSAVMIAELRARRDDFLPAYYVQDYEPFFTGRDTADVVEAIASYTLIPDCLLFAKTHWLCNIVSARHGVHVAKVEPSIDESIYRPRDLRPDRGPLCIAAMVRPRTPRRQPSATVAVMEELSREFGEAVRVTPFGCSTADLERLTDHEPLLRRHRGLLSRAEVAELLGSSDVFLDMSMYQAFGRTALEAMACGATAVVPRLGGVWEFLEHGENGFAIDAFEPQQAYDVLAGLVDDRRRVIQLQARARQTGAKYSILRAALSEYLVFAREHALRFGSRSPAGA